MDSDWEKLFINWRNFLGDFGGKAEGNYGDVLHVVVMRNKLTGKPGGGGDDRRRPPATTGEEEYEDEHKGNLEISYSFRCNIKVQRQNYL